MIRGSTQGSGTGPVRSTQRLHRRIPSGIGGAYFDKRRNSPARQRRLVAQLEAMGHHVPLERTAA